MIHKAGFPALALIGVALFAACGGGGSGTTTTIRTVVPRTVVAVATTGVPALDQIIIAAADADTIELAGLTGYQRIPCKKDIPQPAPGDPPLCRDNESDGASVEVLPSAKCEGGWVRPEQVPDAFRAALGDSPPKLVAVYRPKLDANAPGGSSGAQQVVVFDTGAQQGGDESGAAFHIRDGRVVLIATACTKLSDLIAPNNVASFIIEPTGASGSAAATPTAAPPP